MTGPSPFRFRAAKMAYGGAEKPVKPPEEEQSIEEVIEDLEELKEESLENQAKNLDKLSLEELIEQVDSLNSNSCGVTDNYELSERDKNTPKPRNAFLMIERIVLDTLREKSLRIPVHIRYKSKMSEVDATKPVAVLIGEQHPGGRHKNINYAKTNRSITEVLIALYLNQELKLGDALKEGSSELKASPELNSMNKEDLLLAEYSPLVTIVNLLNKDKEFIKVHASESMALVSKFAILSFLFSSLPGSDDFPEQEQQRIAGILGNGISEEKYQMLQLMVKDLAEKLELEDLVKKGLVKRKSFDLKPEAKNYRMPLELYLCRSNAGDKEEYKELLELLALKLRMLLQFVAIKRDEYIVEQFLKFKAGIHPIVIGELHLTNLTQLLEEKGVPVIVLSPFV